ncbi:ATP-binding cassette domain-containing protein [Motilibacter aurantiacus]|uniref:ATP-binding cassette domain-containing protein n=1 Tax=Motilibacter aurantiacus TaxID=2714955 RepID=UPI00140AAA25|nr:ATP-binding cassette domain-containing protein [Motilibacter aurantiacus]NHC46165.1 ATP-binding cassette domain-containing protein [Motilibacter aurantiacus]
MSPTEPAVLAEGLGKSFGPVRALERFDLAVPAGSVCGLLGPNGAGKTTAVRVLSTLLRPDAGTARVAGADVERDPGRVRASIGLVGQHAALDEALTGRQNLEMFARLHHLRPRTARARADELLAAFGLDDAGGRQVSGYSGGMRRRLDLAAGLVVGPAVLFLDEPTTGLDPAARADVWQAIRRLVAAGTTVLLTTQYLEEADQLASRVCVVAGGTVVAEGTPQELKARLGADRVEAVVRHARDLEPAAALVARATGAGAQADQATRRVQAPAPEGVRTLAAVLDALERAGIEVEDVGLRRPTLDEVFLHLTGPAAGAEVAA